MKLKELQFADVAEIQEASTEELKNVQKEKFSAAFQKLYDGAKICIYGNGSYFEF
jgi:exopolysaccharide biosynthesis protein